MIISSKTRTMRQGFTLVEMLVVVAIIGILAGLISAVAVKAIGTAKRTDIVIQLSELDRVLKAYKDKYGEYPPDGTDLTDANSNGIPDSFERHFQKVFPKANLATEPGSGYVSELGILYQINKFGYDPKSRSDMVKLFADYSPSTALTFWLGGMQENNYTTVATKNPKSRFVGFSANPIHPLSDGASTRLPSLYEFDTGRINDPTGATMSPTFFRSYQGNANVPLPFVYFRAELNQRYPYLTSPTTVPVNTRNRAKFYGDPQRGPKPYYDSVSQSWINPTSYQILFCGFDNTFGPGNWYPSGKVPTNLPTLPPPYNILNIYYSYGANNDNSQYDDITNFAGGAVGDKVP